MIVVSVYAHGNVLYNANLDFDPELKANVVKAAQEFGDIDEEPVRFDFDKELIRVHFDRELEYSVTINPSDYSIAGFRDDSLLSREKEVNFDQDQRKEIALEIFDSLPKEIKSRLRYGGEKKLYSGTYELSWYRYHDNIYVSGDHLSIEIDPVDGDVIAWRLSVFFYPDSQIQAVPAINHRIAENIALLKMDAEKLDFDPLLVIYKTKPMWITKVRSLYPIFVGIDALDGNLLFSGTLRDELPPDYDYGRNLEIVETEFIADITDVHKTI